MFRHEPEPMLTFGYVAPLAFTYGDDSVLQTIMIQMRNRLDRTIQNICSHITTAAVPWQEELMWPGRPTRMRSEKRQASI